MIDASVSPPITWSRDGRFLFYRKIQAFMQPGGATSICRYDASKRVVETFGMPHDFAIFDASPDGQSIVYELDSKHLAIYSLESGSEALLRTSAVPGALQDIAWVQPDRIVLLKRINKRYAVPYLIGTGGGNPVKLPIRVECDTPVYWTTGDGMLAYASEDDAFHVYDLESGKDQRLNTRAACGPSPMSGSECLGISRERLIYAYHGSTPSSAESARKERGTLVSQTPSLDVMEALTMHVDRFDLRTMKGREVTWPCAAEQEPSPVTGQYTFSCSSLSSDGRRLATVDISTGKLHVVDLPARTVRQLGSVPVQR